MNSPVDFGALYDAHPEYFARRLAGSFEQAQIDIEVMLFKLPQLLTVWPEARAARSMLEIGCATGELLAAMPIAEGGLKVGIDISASNVSVAAERHPGIEFRCGDFRTQASETFDIAVSSDALEHVPDDHEFLRDAAALADTVLLNLPLEDNWLNSGRRYGPDDVSGQLRRYCLADGLALVAAEGLEVLGQTRAWVHESSAEVARRELRRERQGAAFSGAWPARTLCQAIDGTALAVPGFGRRMLASNPLLAARSRGRGRTAAQGTPT